MFVCVCCFNPLMFSPTATSTLDSKVVTIDDLAYRRSFTARSAKEWFSLRREDIGSTSCSSKNVPSQTSTSNAGRSEDGNGNDSLSPIQTDSEEEEEESIAPIEIDSEDDESKAEEPIASANRAPPSSDFFAIYNLWNLDGFRILVRSRFDARLGDCPVVCSSKIENLHPREEHLSAEQISTAWMRLRLCPQAVFVVGIEIFLFFSFFHPFSSIHSTTRYLLFDAHWIRFDFLVIISPIFFF